MMSESRQLQITEFLEVVRSIIDSCEFNVAGISSASDAKFRIKRAIVQLQVAQKNIQFAIDGLEDTLAAKNTGGESAAAVVGPNAG